MQVIIPAIDENCVASLALRKEGIEHDVVVMDGDYDYGELLVELWQSGESFILLEHDVVPWPGAITQLAECPELWCSYEYPLAPNTLRPALGCIKVSCIVINAYRNLPARFGWAERIWSQMDGAVCPALESIAGKTHIHKPPLAHVKL